VAWPYRRLPDQELLKLRSVEKIFTALNYKQMSFA
jgi:hypothetical protein